MQLQQLTKWKDYFVQFNNKVTSYISLDNLESTQRNIDEDESITFLYSEGEVLRLIDANNTEVSKLMSVIEHLNQGIIEVNNVRLPVIVVEDKFGRVVSHTYSGTFKDLKIKLLDVVIDNNIVKAQPQVMKFDPATGTRQPYPSDAMQYREYHGNTAWLFDPWDGRRRSASDVGSDVTGILIRSTDDELDNSEEEF